MNIDAYPSRTALLEPNSALTTTKSTVRQQTLLYIEHLETSITCIIPEAEGWGKPQ